MIKVTAQNGNTFDFAADTWTSHGNGGIALYKGGVMVAEFSSFMFVQAVKEETEVEPGVQNNAA